MQRYNFFLKTKGFVTFFFEKYKIRRKGPNNHNKKRGHVSIESHILFLCDF
jgi:hypothetical protein